MKLYVDGLLAGTAAVDGPLAQSRAPLLIGTGQNLSMDTFQGRLDDVRIYDRALSSAEVEALYFGPIDEVASAITSADSEQGVEAAKQNRDLTLAVANQTDTPVCMLYISPVGYDGPHVERLCGDYIMPGTMFGDTSCRRVGTIRF